MDTHTNSGCTSKFILRFRSLVLYIYHATAALSATYDACRSQLNNTYNLQIDTPPSKVLVTKYVQNPAGLGVPIIWDLDCVNRNEFWAPLPHLCCSSTAQ